MTTAISAVLLMLRRGVIVGEVVPNRSVRRAGTFLAVGSGVWAFHGALMFVALIQVLLVFDFAQLNPIESIAAVDRTVYLAALAVAVVAAVLFAVGLLAFRDGAVTGTDPGRMGAYEYRLSHGTLVKAQVTAGLLVAYGAIALWALLSLQQGQASQDVMPLFWIFGPIPLVLSAAAFAPLCRSLAEETGGFLYLRGTLLSAYAVANLLGAVFFGIAFLLGPDPPEILNTLGVLSQLLGASFTGAADFSIFVTEALAVRRTRRAVKPTPVASPAVGPLRAPQPPSLESTTSVSREAVPSGEFAASRPKPVAGDASEAMRLPSDIENLYTSIAEQRLFLAEFENEWREGRVDRSTFDSVSSARRQRIDALRKEIAETQSRLTE